jgi:hypothetical protein
MELTPDIERAADLLDALRRSIHKTYWSYSAQLERLKLFKKGHDQDTKSWSDRAQSDPTDQNLQRLAENGSQGIGYLDLLLTELQDYSSSFQSFMLFVDDVESQLRIPRI